MGGAHLLNNLILRKIYYKSYHSLDVAEFQSINEIQSRRGRCRWCRDLLVNRTSKQYGKKEDKNDVSSRFASFEKRRPSVDG